MKDKNVYKISDSELKIVRVTLKCHSSQIQYLGSSITIVVPCSESLNSLDHDRFGRHRRGVRDGRLG